MLKASIAVLMVIHHVRHDEMLCRVKSAMLTAIYASYLGHCGAYQHDCRRLVLLDIVHAFLHKLSRPFGCGYKNANTHRDRSENQGGPVGFLQVSRMTACCLHVPVAHMETETLASRRFSSQQPGVQLKTEKCLLTPLRRLQIDQRISPHPVYCYCAVIP